MANSGPGQNASVEEILASIRQAISEDDARRTTISRRRPEPRALVDGRPVVSVGRIFAEDDADTDEPVETPEGEGDSEETVDEGAEESEPSLDQGVIELAIEQALSGVRAEMEGRKPAASRLRTRQELVKATSRAIPRAARVLPPRREAPARRALLSPQVDAQVSASFDDLAKAMIEGNANKLDEVVEDLLRPMLKTWLENNLPSMVERLVREEIERVARGRR